HLGMDLLSSDPADLTFMGKGDLRLSTSKLYTWDFVYGPGRVDSGVDNFWMCKGVEVVEAEYQTEGLQAEVEDKAWDAICETIRDSVPPPSNEVVTEVYRWAHRLARNKSETFSKSLDDSPPQNRTLIVFTIKRRCPGSRFVNKHWTLKPILTKMADTARLWSTRSRDEDTYLKCQQRPFPDTYFGKLRYTKSDWTPVQDDIRSFVCFRTAGRVLYHLEATNVMHRFVVTYLAPEAMNVFPLVHLAEIFEYIQGKVQQTVTQIRQVKIRPSSNPKIPLSWLRPSFKNRGAVRLLMDYKAAMFAYCRINISSHTLSVERHYTGNLQLYLHIPWWLLVSEFHLICVYHTQ
ncbi:hypothetical protein BGW38_001184, partial [Lunasporangiospora selenospora]